jgi:tetratricopeptide (TPR) repeat protein
VKPEKAAKRDVAWKKLGVACGLFWLLVVVPLWLGSTPMMEVYQRSIDRNPYGAGSRWLQLATADVCYQTYRPEMAAAKYRRFLENYSNDERRSRALLRLAQSLEAAGCNQEAILVYHQYLDEYPDRDDRKMAVQGIDRIRYIPPAP